MACRWDIRQALVRVGSSIDRPVWHSRTTFTRIPPGHARQTRPWPWHWAKRKASPLTQRPGFRHLASRSAPRCSANADVTYISLITSFIMEDSCLPQAGIPIPAGKIRPAFTWTSPPSQIVREAALRSPGPPDVRRTTGQ